MAAPKLAAVAHDGCLVAIQSKLIRPDEGDRKVGRFVDCLAAAHKSKSDATLIAVRIGISVGGRHVAQNLHGARFLTRSVARSVSLVGGVLSVAPHQRRIQSQVPSGPPQGASRYAAAIGKLFA